jgi:hypothetical protein
MKRALGGLALGLLVGGPAVAQEAALQTSQQNNVRLRVDGLFRQEWTKDIFVPGGPTLDVDRQRGQARPRLEFGRDRFTVAVGGDFNYSSDTNYDPKPALMRDNYKSRDARLDLAFVRGEPLSWLRLEGGRFFMPVGLTEMLWDRDLRPQGAALTLQHKDASGVSRVGLTGLWARGSHVFEDQDVQMVLVSGHATFTGTAQSSFQLMASYLDYIHPNSLEPMLHRQNTQILGAIVQDYHVVDLMARVGQEGGMAAHLVADYCWNTAVSDNNKGLWIAAVLGSLKNSRARAEYTYAKVDKDATLGAYATDDFFWSTGWEGHRGELATRISDKSSFHAIGQYQKFKDSPRPEERDHWVRRFRLEVRVAY